MKRNFGSLNLAALDLDSPFNTSTDSADCSLEERFSAMDTSADDHSMDASASEYSSDDNVGFPMERMDLPLADVHSAPRSLREQVPEDMDMEDAMPELTLPVRSQSASRPHSEYGDVRLLHPSSPEIPQHLHEQHHVELNALRCLSLKVMLSNLNNNNNNNSANASVASNKPNFTYPGVNDRAKTALLPIRHPSLQSV